MSSTFSSARARRFADATGIAESAWLGKHWARWGDALREAGFEPNKRQRAFSEDFILDKLIEFTSEIGHFPVAAELRMRAKEDSDFPSHNVFGRLGRKHERIVKVLERCEQLGDLEVVRSACLSALPAAQQRVSEKQSVPARSTGYVYLMTSGRYYKIGSSNSPGRREYELALQLPEVVTQIHAIETDDPEGIVLAQSFRRPSEAG